MDISNVMPGTMISLSGEVEEKMLQTLEVGLKTTLESEKKRATILLTTHGGSVDFGEAIAERIEIASKFLDIRIIGATFVQSAGVRIFLSLPRERRFLTKRCTIMIHRIKSGRDLPKGVSLTELEGKLLEHVGHVRQTMALETRMVRRLCKETGIKKSKLLELYGNGHYFSAKEAIRLGLASAIVP